MKSIKKSRNKTSTEKTLFSEKKLADTPSVKEQIVETISRNNFDAFKVLFDKHQQNINTLDFGNKTTALHLAISEQRQSITKFLIDNGANVNAADNSKVTPLHIAIIFAPLSIIKLLVEKGANINAQRNDGNTPLHIAIKSGRKDIVFFLLEKNANVNGKNELGNTPLHCAGLPSIIEIVKLVPNIPLKCDLKDKILRKKTPSEEDYKEIAKMLLDKGADIEATNNDNMTPLYIALQNNRYKLVMMLIEHGANVMICASVKSDPIHLKKI